MKTTVQRHHQLQYTIASLFLFVIVISIAVFTRLWVLTAVPIGFLFGFFLQKGDLCGSSAFSEVLLLRSWKKIFGLWVCIVVSMAGFALLDLLGWVTLNPKPLIWLSAIAGGVIFGAGMVLAGGCVSGCLYKTGTGNLNSMAGLAGIPLGVGMVEYGPMNSLHLYMKSFVVKPSEGTSVTLSSVSGLPYWAIALILGALTLLPFLLIRSRSKPKNQDIPWLERLLNHSWKPWQAGIAIGLLAMPAYLSSAASGRNYPLGVTHGVLHAELLIADCNLDHVWQPKKTIVTKPAVSTTTTNVSSNPAPPPRKKVVWWLVALVVSLVLGSWGSGKLSGDVRLLPKPPEQTVVAFFGGFLVGIGAAFATGCVIGNILSGWALMSVGMFLFGIVTLLSNWITTYFYLMGGTLFRSK